MKRIGTRRAEGGSPSRFVLVAFLAVLAISSGSCSGSGGTDEAVLPGALPPSLPSPRNVIVMIADGAGFPQFDAAEAYVLGSTGAGVTSTFPVRLAMETSSFAQRYDPLATWQDFSFSSIFPPSSNASATALSSGKATWGLYLGLDPSGRPVEHFFERASAAGKSTGAVTSVPISHATPTGFVVHKASRFSYEAIAMEMLTASSLDLLMGCGHPHHDVDGLYVASPDADAFRYVGGSAAWNALEAGTLGNDADGDGIDDPWTLLTSRAEVLALATDPEPPERVLALAPNAETLQRNRGGDHMAAPDVVPPLANQPTLAEFAAGALNVLSRNPSGFALVIEGGAIDWACHANEGGRMIEEQRDFDETVKAVMAWVEAHSSWDETLLLVTADHETGHLTGVGSGPTASGPVWTPIVPIAPGVAPAVEFHGTGHTSHLVPFHAKGMGAQHFVDLADETDPVRGPYLRNDEVGALLGRFR